MKDLKVLIVLLIILVMAISVVFAWSIRRNREQPQFIFTDAFSVLRGDSIAIILPLSTLQNSEIIRLDSNAYQIQTRWGNFIVRESPFDLLEKTGGKR